MPRVAKKLGSKNLQRVADIKVETCAQKPRGSAALLLLAILGVRIQWDPPSRKGPSYALHGACEGSEWRSVYDTQITSKGCAWRRDLFATCLQKEQVQKVLRNRYSKIEPNGL